VATYLAVIGIFLISGANASSPMATLPRRFFADIRRTGRRSLVTGLAFVIAATAAVWLFPRESTSVLSASSQTAGSSAAPQSTPDQRSEFERWYTAQLRVPLVVPTEGARVLIVDFSDFQCPYCRQAFYSLKPIIAKYNAQQPGSVRLVLKDYPLDSECNVNVQGGGPHPSACEAAVAVRLARARSRENEMEEWLFSNQPTLTPELVKKAALDVGQVPDFEAKYAPTLDLVKSDIAFGKTLGVSATPTIFINGVKIAGVLAPQYFDQAIAYELQRTAAAPSK
jgi:protein-disulfide isomerase